MSYSAHWAGRRRRGRRRREASRSARCGNAWAQATSQKPHAGARPACTQGNAHARSTSNSVLWHRAAAAGQRHTRTQQARRGARWVGRRAHYGIDRSTQARHRSVVFSMLGQLCRNGPCEPPTSRMTGRQAASVLTSARLGNGRAALRRWSVQTRACRASNAAEAERSRSAACQTLRVRCSI